MRPIDADKLLQVLNEEKKNDDCRGFWYTTVCGMARIVESAPVIDMDDCIRRQDAIDAFSSWDEYKAEIEKILQKLPSVTDKRSAK